MTFISFIFSSFWIWLGFIILVGTVLNGLANILGSIRGKPEEEE